MLKLTNRNAEIRVVDLVLGLALEMTVVLLPEVANLCVRLCVRVCTLIHQGHPPQWSLHGRKSILARRKQDFAQDFGC